MDIKMERKKKLLLTPLLPLLLSVCFFLVCHIELTSSQALKSYGEACDADCDERQLLTCSQNNSICECMQPSSMVYDKNQRKCVGRAGFPCVRYATELLCVQYGHCNKTSKKCNCEKGYFETENGTCSIMAKYGDPCSSKRPCDRSSGMNCMERIASTSSSSGSGGGSGRVKRTCQCMYPSDQYYDPAQKSCVSYAGGNCSFAGICIRNALCSEDIYELRHGENIHGKPYSYKVAVGRKCACQEGTTVSRDRQCLRSYQQPCDPESGRGNGGCNSEENLKCFDSSVCLCTNPLSQIYDRALHKCVYLVDAKCIAGKEETGGDDADTTADDALCTANSYCNSVTGKCECLAGYSSSPYSTCLKDFGTECGADDDGSNGTCNLHRGLSCHQSSGTCGCIDDDTLKYDVNTKTCQSVVEGGPCGTFEYSDKSGFVVGERNGGAVIMMGSHNREVVKKGGGSSTTAAFGITNNGNHNSNATSSVLPAPVTNSEKTFLTLTKIHIKCTSELECANEFGEIMGNGRNSADGSIFHGFCRKRR